MRLPNYWDSDLGIYKSFHITESQSIEIRASATNWLNHPLGQFGLAGNSDITLNFQQQTPATCAGCAGLNVTSRCADQPEQSNHRRSKLQNRLTFCDPGGKVLLLSVGSSSISPRGGVRAALLFCDYAFLPTSPDLHLRTPF